MAEVRSTESVNALMHELAEGLQATGSYLSALRRTLRRAGTIGDDESEVIERALAQWARSQHAMRELRAFLCDPNGSGDD